VRRSIDPSSLNIVIIGLAITSSWGNGHATTYRSLVKGLHALGHRVLFMEQDQPWYAAHRDAPQLPHCDTQLYRDLHDLRARFAEHIRSADAVIVGSYVRDGVAVSDWVLNEARNVRAFYDIDTPLTLASLHGDACEYLRARQIHAFDIVLSFAGGPTLTELERCTAAWIPRDIFLGGALLTSTSATWEPTVPTGNPLWRRSSASLRGRCRCSASWSSAHNTPAVSCGLPMSCMSIICRRALIPVSTIASVGR